MRMWDLKESRRTLMVLATRGKENLFLDQNEWSGVSWHGVDQLSRCFAGCDNKIRRRVKKGQGV